MSVAIKKIQGVESVDVSLNNGLATIRLKAGNSVSLEQVRQRIEQNGFTPKDAKVTARGEVISTGGKLQFKLLGVNRIYDISLDSTPGRLSDEIKKQTGKTVFVEGIIPAHHPPKKAKAPPIFQLKAIKAHAGHLPPGGAQAEGAAHHLMHHPSKVAKLVAPKGR